TARCALAAAFMLEECRDTPDSLNDVCGLVHHDHAARTEGRLDFTKTIKIHDDVLHVFAANDWARRAAWNNAQEIVPTATNATAVVFDELTESQTELIFECAWTLYMAGHHEQLGANVVWATDGREPACAATQDRRRDSDGFNVVHSGRASIKTHIRREWRLQTWLTLFAFQAFEKRSF